jgi:hypothetical protein
VFSLSLSLSLSLSHTHTHTRIFFVLNRTHTMFIEAFLNNSSVVLTVEAMRIH